MRFDILWWACGLACLLASVLVAQPYLASLLSMLVWGFCVLAVGSGSQKIVGIGSLYILLLGFYHLVATFFEVVLGLDIGLNFTSDGGTLAVLPLALKVTELALVAASAGYLLCRPARIRQPSVATDVRRLGTLGVTITAGGVISVVLFLTINHLWGASYTEFWIVTRGVAATSRGNFLMVVGYVLVSAGFALVIVRIGERGGLRLFCVTVLLCSPMLLYGFRGIVTIATLIGGVEWCRSGSRRRLLGLGGLAVVIILILPVLTDLRSRFDPQGTGERSDLSPIERVVSESGGTMRALVYSITKVESSETELWYGRSFAASALRIVPFSTAIFEFQDRDDVRPAMWWLIESNQWKLERGLGQGFSGVAEAYLNLGSVGVLLIFIVLGGVIRIADKISPAGAGNPFGVVLAIWLIWWIRNDSEAVIRPAIWSLMVVTAVLVYAKRRSRRATYAILKKS